MIASDLSRRGLLAGAGAVTLASCGRSAKPATAAYLAVEGARPLLHGCDEHNGFSGKPRVATASIALELDARGKVIRSHVDPSSGDAALVTCATQALERTVFPPPPGGTGSVLTRISFNPRSGAR